MRLDQRDSYAKGMDAVVTCVQRDGDAVWVTLDASVFYPTAGGQLHDVGVLLHAGGEARVVDVTVDKEAGGMVRHRVEGVQPEVGDAVRGEIDWDRRYRHMQRHSAQHLVSQAFLQVNVAFETQSVSLASPEVTIDFAGDPRDEDVAAAFNLARTWAYEDLEIRAFEVDDADLVAYPLRRPPKVQGRIRLVQMGDVEIAACGGTHLARAAEMLPLLAVGRQRIRGDLTRVSFLAGWEAQALAQSLLEDVDALARSFSAGRNDVPARVETLRSELQAVRFAHARALSAWTEARVGGLAAEATDGVLHLRVDAPEGTSARDALAAMAEATSKLRPDVVTILGAVEEVRATVLVQVGAERVGVDARTVLQAALAVIEGRGGGKPDRAQGSGSDASQLDPALDAAARKAAEQVASVRQRA